MERRFQDERVEEWSFTDGGVGEDRDADAGRSVGHACVEGVRLGEQADRGRAWVLPEHGEAMAGGGRLVRREGPDHAPEFTVAVRLADGSEAQAKAASKRNAEQAAAQQMLDQLG